MTFDGNELIARLVAMEQEVIPGCDAVPHFWHVQEAGPYWTNRIGEMSVASDTEEFDDVTATVYMRLHIGHITEGGYQGEPDSKLYGYIPDVVKFFNDRQLLTSAQYEEGMRYLMEARIVSVSGYTVFMDTGDGAGRVGTEFGLRCVFTYDINQYE